VLLADDMPERDPRFRSPMTDPSGQALTVERLLAGGAAESAARPLPGDRLAAYQARLGAAETERTSLAPTDSASVFTAVG
jgi:hypothetical protein